MIITVRLNIVRLINIRVLTIHWIFNFIFFNAWICLHCLILQLWIALNLLYGVSFLLNFFHNRWVLKTVEATFWAIFHIQSVKAIAFRHRLSLIISQHLFRFNFLCWNAHLGTVKLNLGSSWILIADFSLTIFRERRFIALQVFLRKWFVLWGLLRRFLESRYKRAYSVFGLSNRFLIFFLFSSWLLTLLLFTRVRIEFTILHEKKFFLLIIFISIYVH